MCAHHGVDRVLHLRALLLFFFVADLCNESAFQMV